MKALRSLRLRIQLWHGLFLLAVLIGLGAAAWRFEKASTFKRLDEDLLKRLSLVEEALPRDGSRRPPPPVGPPGDRRPPPDGFGGPGGFTNTGRPPRGEAGPALQFPVDSGVFFGKKEPGFYYVIWRRGGGTSTSSADAPPGIPVPPRQSTSNLATIFRDRGDQREVYRFTPPGECLMTGASTAPAKAELRRFGWKLAGIESAILLLGLGGGGWFTTRSLRPLAQISATSRAIADGRLDQRIPDTRPGSELGDLSEQLNHTFSRLESSFAKQARFTSDAAHELRTPLTVIISQAQLALRGERPAEEYREMFEACLRSAIRMRDLTQSLLELARLDNEAGLHQRVPADLSQIAREAIPLLEQEAAEKHIRCIRDLSPTPFLGDPDTILRVLINLIGNAILHCPEGTTITVTSGAREGQGFISIADDGPGIPEKDLPLLFDRFYRVDSSRNRKTGGTGLGLSICKAIAEAHGGKLEVMSRIGEGSVFTLRLPGQ